MSTHRNGDDQLSGKAHRPEAAPHQDSTAERDGTDDLDDIAERFGEAVRNHPVSKDGEQAALAAFRAARAADSGALRTRRRDRWGPVTRRQRWTRTGALTVAASTLLGGIAVASIGVVTQARHHASDVRSSSSSLPSHGPDRGQQTPMPTTTGAPPTASPSHPGGAKDIEAHCHAFEKGKGRAHALKVPAWQRLVRAAGGEQQVARYCARLTGSTNDTQSAPAKTNEGRKNGEANSREKRGKGEERRSAKPGQSKGPGGRS
ncbi:hypothetical protein ACFW9D_22725 [Streptomyces sp. NPDC059524]|uniref:hypothetical protein n=1 Tax=Streptomyces sp. NPDC059524 TaxID=3346856 RepID=UPI0036BAD424